MDTQTSGASPSQTYIEDDIEGVGRVRRHHRVTLVRGSSVGWQVHLGFRDGRKLPTRFFAISKHGGAIESLQKANDTAVQMERQLEEGTLEYAQKGEPKTRWAGAERKVLVEALERALRGMGVVDGTGNAKQFREALMAAQEQCVANGTLRQERARDTYYFTLTRQKSVVKDLLKLQAKLAEQAPKPKPPEPPEPEPEEAVDDEPSVIGAGHLPPPPPAEQFTPPDLFSYRAEPFDYVAEEHHAPPKAPRQQQSVQATLAAQIGKAIGTAIGNSIGDLLKEAIAAFTAALQAPSNRHSVEDAQTDPDEDAQTEEDRRIDEMVLRGQPEEPPAHSEHGSALGEVVTSVTPPAPPKTSAIAQAMERASTNKLANEARKNEPLPPPVGRRPTRVLVCGLNPIQRQPLARKYNRALDLRFYDSGTGREELQAQVKHAEYVLSTIKQDTGIAAAILAVQRKQFHGDKSVRFQSFDAARVDNVDMTLERLALAGHL